MRKESKWEPRIDLRPNDVLPMVSRPHNAFELVNAGSVKFSNVKVSFSGNRSDYGLVINNEASELSGSIVEEPGA